MYDCAAGVWQGLAKNATEGMAVPVAILPWTLLLGLGQVAPPFVLAGALVMGAGPAAVTWAAVATAASYLPRLDAAWRFRGSWTGALLHPVGVALLLAIQWHALAHHLAGRPASWRGRSYPAAGA